MNGFEGILFTAILLAFLAACLRAYFRGQDALATVPEPNPTQKSCCGIPDRCCLHCHSVCNG